MQKQFIHQDYIFSFLCTNLTLIEHRAELLSGAARLSSTKIF